MHSCQCNGGAENRIESAHAINVMVKHDTSAYGKPRSTRGTPMAKFTSRLAIGTLTLGLAAAYWFSVTPFTGKLRGLLETLYEDSIENRERKHNMGLKARLPSAELRKQMEEAEMPYLPDK